MPKQSKFIGIVFTKIPLPDAFFSKPDFHSSAQVPQLQAAQHQLAQMQHQNQNQQQQQHQQQMLIQQQNMAQQRQQQQQAIIQQQLLQQQQQQQQQQQMHVPPPSSNTSIESFGGTGMSFEQLSLLLGPEEMAKILAGRSSS